MSETLVGVLIGGLLVTVSGLVVEIIRARGASGLDKEKRADDRRLGRAARLNVDYQRGPGDWKVSRPTSHSSAGPHAKHLPANGLDFDDLIHYLHALVAGLSDDPPPRANLRRTPACSQQQRHATDL